MTAYRYTDRAVRVGDELPASHEWVGDEMTGVELDGTCAFAALEQAMEYARWSPGQVVEIEGELAHYGSDMEGEVIVADARVTRIVRPAGA